MPIAGPERGDPATVSIKPRGVMVGVTGGECADSVPWVHSVDGLNVNVDAIPLMSLWITVDVADGDPLTSAGELGIDPTNAFIAYCTIGRPPSKLGAGHWVLAELRPATAVIAVGADGATYA